MHVTTFPWFTRDKVHTELRLKGDESDKYRLREYGSRLQESIRSATKAAAI